MRRGPKFLAIVVGFVHDFAAGCWAATVLAVYLLEREAQSGLPELAAPLAGIQRFFFVVGLFSVAVVFASGVGRTFTYVENVYGVEAERQRRRMLLYKHALLLLVFGSGIWWQYAMIF